MPLIATLRFAQRYTARIDFSSRAAAEADLARTNALLDPDEADDNGLRLTLPQVATDVWRPRQGSNLRPAA
jgi:hypothetical protein